MTGRDQHKHEYCCRGRSVSPKSKSLSLNQIVSGFHRLSAPPLTNSRLDCLKIDTSRGLTKKEFEITSKGMIGMNDLIMRIEAEGQR